MYYLNQPIYIIPEYISRKMKASPNILYNDYGEAFTFTCMSISHLRLEVWYVLSWPAYLYHTRVYTIEMGVSSNILYNISEEAPI